MDVRLGNKFDHYLFLKQEQRLVPYLPKTTRFSKEALFSFINTYKRVVVKPAFSLGEGKGILLMKALRNGEYEIFIEANKQRFKSFEEAYKYIIIEIDKNKEKEYIIQQYIEFATSLDRQVAFRFLVQRRIGREWFITGEYANRAKEGYFVTNLRNKKELVSLENMFNFLPFDKQLQLEILKDMDFLALITAQRLGQAFKEKNLWGIDIGIDRSGAVWLIDAASEPRTRIFRKLEDKLVYQTIRSIIKHNKQYRKTLRQHNSGS